MCKLLSNVNGNFPFHVHVQKLRPNFWLKGTEHQQRRHLKLWILMKMDGNKQEHYFIFVFFVSAYSALSYPLVSLVVSNSTKYVFFLQLE